VLRGGLRPSPSLLLPTVLGCLAPLAPVAAPLKREAAVSTAACDGRSNVGARGVGGVGDGSVGGIGGACGVCGGGSAGCATRGVCGSVTGGLSRSSSTISAMVVEFELDVELTTAPFRFWVRQTPSPAACLALAAVVYRLEKVGTLQLRAVTGDCGSARIQLLSPGQQFNREWNSMQWYLLVGAAVGLSLFTPVKAVLRTRPEQRQWHCVVRGRQAPPSWENHRDSTPSEQAKLVKMVNRHHVPAGAHGRNSSINCNFEACSQILIPVWVSWFEESFHLV